MAKTKVVVLGGGVAGLSAAHELSERGFDVEVYELKGIPGGKARSIPNAGTGTDGRPDLPGEHGFRFFPGFYKHLPDTMKRIPYGTNRLGVFDNLIEGSQFEVARLGKTDPVYPARFPHSFDEFVRSMRELFTQSLGVPDEEMLYFIDRLLVILTSCQERRDTEYEKISWWDFIGAAQRSKTYQAYLALGLTRSLVAMRADVSSTRTIGAILPQLFFSMGTPGTTLDRVLDGPTNEVWIDPWITYLEQTQGVRYTLGAKVVSLDFDGAVITSATIDFGDGSPPRQVTGDYYVAALPVEVMTSLVTPALAAADPALGRLSNLRTEWMNGIQFYLKADVPLANGHTIFTDSPWALTSVSQAQFWDRAIGSYGDGTATGILSVDISDWNANGIVYGKPARELTTPQQIVDEVLAQIRAAFPDEPGLADANIAGWFLDPDIIQPNGGSGVTNLEPLLINTCDSLKDRPGTQTRIPNLLLASDYVLTYTDLATMEAANEAARRATNAILAATGSNQPPCELWPLAEPAIFEPLKVYDYARFELGLPHAGGDMTALLAKL